MAVELVLPRLGWTMEEGTLVEWLKQDGDRVEVGEIVFTVETEKALNEVEALDSGILRIPPDSPPPVTTVPVGTLLAYLVAPGEAIPVDGGARKVAEMNAVSSMPAQATAQPQPSVRSAEDEGEGPTISPRARRMAEAQGVDWRSLKGSGRGGRIVERDVEEAAALKQGSASDELFQRP